jgi:hypothetical protein
MWMLPNLRMVPVGGVLIAIIILTLNLTFSREVDSRAALATIQAPARGALIASGEHPEWRQFVILAAFTRADELTRLRELPDAPSRAATAPDADKAADKVAAKVAALPDTQDSVDPDDVTGSITDNPSASLPVDIGETSAFELPIVDRPETPPVIRVPERIKPAHESENDGGPRARRAKPQAAPPASVH